MEVLWVTGTAAERQPVEGIGRLLADDNGFVWVDVAVCDDDAARVLSEVFGFHPLAVRDCVKRNRVSKVHPYPDHVFVVLHAPERGEGGHVHYVELDQFVGARYLVTGHGPINPAVDPAVALRQTDAVRRRLESGLLRPTSPFDLSYAVVSALTRQQEAFVETLSSDVWSLEQRVTGGHLGDPEELLEELFRVRHGLLAVRTMGAVSSEVYGRMARLDRAGSR